MHGKVLKVTSNDLYGNVEDRVVSVFACFEHTKYMNNYIVFTINNDMKKLYYGSVHFKKKSIVVFAVKKSIKKHIDSFLNEYINDNMSEFKILNINKMEKIELVSYNEVEYDKVALLDSKSIPRFKDENVVVEKENKPLFLYFLVFVLFLFAILLTVLYFKPDIFTIKYNALKCTDNLHDSKLDLHYGIVKDIRFDRKDKVDSVSVTRTYIFLDSNSYYSFKNNDNHNYYFTNGEGYKYIDKELKFKVFYDEKTVIDDYDEMLTYMRKEGFVCEQYEYEK